MSYEQTIKYLYDLQPIGIKFGLNNTLSLLEYFNHPHHHLKTIHVAGTNGKGSVCAMLYSILQASGYKVGLYTSPHLIDFTERISINGRPVPPSEVVTLTERIKEAISHGDFSSGHPTFFEVVTVMALVYFAEQKVDLAIMEVGMGGRLDATNVINPLLGIITTIDFDHQQYLGHSLLEIAREKAGIIKKNMQVLVGQCQPEVLELFTNICEERRASLVHVPSLVKTGLLYQDLSGQGFEFSSSGSTPQKYFIPLLGRHQIHNASLAIVAAQKLAESFSYRIHSHHIEKGLTCTEWPGRIEVYPGSPLIIIDGAHNPAGAHQLSLFLKEAKFPNIILIMGIMKDKDIFMLCRELVPLASRIILTRPAIERAARPREIKDIMLSSFLVNEPDKIEMSETIPQAIQLAKKLAGAQGLIVITGSLYTVGEAKVVLNAR